MVWKSIGPNQHFSKSIFRAIENNTFFLRSANKGISAIIDNKGAIIKTIKQKRDWKYRVQSTVDKIK